MSDIDFDLPEAEGSTELTTVGKGLTPAERTALIPSVASARFSGLSERKVASTLKISVRQVRAILNCQEYDEFLKELQTQSLKHAMSSFRNQLDKMSPLAVKALRTNLEEGKIEAVKLYTQLIGALKPDEKADQQQNLQIVIPEGMLPKSVLDV